MYLAKPVGYLVNCCGAPCIARFTDSAATNAARNIHKMIFVNCYKTMLSFCSRLILQVSLLR